MPIFRDGLSKESDKNAWNLFDTIIARRNKKFERRLLLLLLLFLAH